MKLESTEFEWLRWSLVFVWLATAGVSVWELDGQSRALLVNAGVHNTTWADGLTVAGAAADGLLGVAMAWRPSRVVYLAALALMLVMTVAATLLAPTLWLHPLGPLTKNVPIAVGLLVLARQSA
ncbi:DoxX-like family protein [Rhodoferax sp.]|uniref:DoxX-like family protein n=1 Tax=Rhodoferax sp. TaxID=50421 RepID=UPI00374CC057